MQYHMVSYSENISRDQHLHKASLNLLTTHAGVTVKHLIRVHTRCWSQLRNRKARGIKQTCSTHLSSTIFPIPAYVKQALTFLVIKEHTLW